MGEVQKRQKGIRDLDFDLENEVKVRRSGDFNWPYLGQFSPQNQNGVLRSASNALRLVSQTFDFDRSTFKLEQFLRFQSAN